MRHTGKKLFAVTGNTTSKSIFPKVFGAFFKCDNSDGVYTQLVADSVQEAFATARLAGFCGLNFEGSMRFDAAAVSDKSFKIVENIGAVDTVVLEGSGKTGYNAGFQAVQPFLCRIFGSMSGSVLMLGTGPDAMAASCAFAAAGWKVTVLGSTLSSAVECAVRCSAAAGEFSDFVEKAKSADLVVCAALDDSCTLDMGRLDGTPVLLLDCAAGFVSRCSSLNLLSSSDLLLAQAAMSYTIFTGTFPSDSAMSAARIALAKKEAKKKAVALVGFESAGRCGCAKVLSDRLGFAFVDLDAEAKNRGVTPAKILKSACDAGNVVISCCATELLSQEDRQILKEKSVAVWLLGASEFIVEKETVISYTPHSGRSMIDAVSRLFDTRTEVYAGIADLVIRSDIRTPEETAIRLAWELREKGLV